MGIYKAEIANMRKNIGENSGQRILIKDLLCKKGKTDEKYATIEKTYTNYFMVKYDSFNRLGTYTYTDLFMKNIEVSIYNGTDYIPLIVPDVSDRKNKLHKMEPEQIEKQIFGKGGFDLPLGIA